MATATINMITEIMTIDAGYETHQLALNPPTASTLHITIAGNSPIVRADTTAAQTLGYRRTGNWSQPGFHPTAKFEPHPNRCDTCASGCHCTTDSEGCGHLGCWGKSDPTCPGIATHRPETGAPAGTSWNILGARWALTDDRGAILALVTNTGISEERNGVFVPQYRVSVGANRETGGYADVETTDGYELAIDLANAKASELLARIAG
jgi:hypothetical protein